jgi:hypothetical protein
MEKIMKKLVFIVAALGVSVSFAEGEIAGVYKSTKKISNMAVGSESDCVAESGTWEEGKCLRDLSVVYDLAATSGSGSEYILVYQPVNESLSDCEGEVWLESNGQGELKGTLPLINPEQKSADECVITVTGENGELSVSTSGLCSVCEPGFQIGTPAKSNAKAVE